MAYDAFLTSLYGLSGTLEAGGLINSYIRNTTTRAQLYRDPLGTPFTTNPVVADSLGQLTFYYRDDVEYFWQATTANGATVLWEAIVIGGAVSFSYVNNGLSLNFRAVATGTGASQVVTIPNVTLTSIDQIRVWVDLLKQPNDGASYTVGNDGTDTYVILTAPSGADIEILPNVVYGLTGPAGTPADIAALSTLPGSDTAVTLAVLNQSGVAYKTDLSSAPIKATSETTSATLAAIAASRVKVLTNYAALQSEELVNNKTVLVLGRNTAGDGGGGQFRVITGDQSAYVTLDPNAGIWVAPTAASSGSSGAWKRIIDSYTNVNPYWWASAATAAGLKTGLTRAVTWLSAVYTSSDECGVVFPAGSHSIDGDITIERPRTVIEAIDGVAELNITSTFSTGIVFQVTGAGTSATASDYLVACGLRGGIRIVHSPSASSTAAAGGTTLWFRQCQNVIWDDQVTISSTAFYGVRFSGGQLNDTMNALRISGRYAPPTRRVTASNSGTEVLTSAAHGWTTGWRLVAMDTAAGVTNGSFYYVRVIDADTFTLHTTKANAIANTSAVNITASIAASSPQLRLRRIGSALVRIEEAECASAVYQTPYTLGWESVSPIGDFAGTAINVTGITQANPAVVTAAAHGFSEGQEVRLSSIGGMTEIIGGCYVAMNVTTNTFELQAPDADGAMQNCNSTAYTAYTSGGSATPVTRYDFLVDLERADGFWINRGYWGSCRYAFIHMHRERESGGVYGAHFGKIYSDAVDADSTGYRSPLYIEWVPADDFSGTARVLADHDGCQVANLRSQASSYGVKYHNATCLSIKWSDTDFRAIARSAVDISGSGGGAFQFSNCTFASGGVGAGSLIATDDVVNVNGADMLCFMGCEFSAAQSGKARIVLAGTIDNFICHSVFDGTSNDITSSATIANQSVLNASGATSPYTNRLTETLRLSGLTYDGTDTISTFTDWATATPTMSTAVAPSGVAITYTTNTMRWMRHGKKVSFFGVIQLSEKGDGSGTVTLVLPSGLPLPNATINTPINIEITSTNGSVLDKDIKGDLQANTRTIRIRRGDVAGSTMSSLDYADIIDTTIFRFSGEYEAQ